MDGTRIPITNTITASPTKRFESLSANSIMAVLRLSKVVIDIFATLSGIGTVMKSTHTFSMPVFVLRVCAGFLLAPFASVTMQILAVWIIEPEFVVGPLELQQMYLLAFWATSMFLIFFGLPVGYFMVRFWRTSIIDFLVLGLAAGPALYLLGLIFFFNLGRFGNLDLMELVKLAGFILLVSLMSAAESVLFWGIARPDKLRRKSPSSSASIQFTRNNGFRGE